MLPPIRIHHPHVEARPDLLAGSPVVRGTRCPVRRLWLWHRKGVSVETLVKRYPSLGAAKILSALAFAYDNQETIAADLERERMLLEEQDHLGEDHERIEITSLARPAYSSMASPAAEHAARQEYGDGAPPPAKLVVPHSSGSPRQAPEPTFSGRKKVTREPLIVEVPTVFIARHAAGLQPNGEPREEAEPSDRSDAELEPPK